MKDDTVIWPSLLELAGCLEGEYADEDFCFIGIIHGQQAPWDYGDKGMAWVRLTNAYPSTDFPAPDDGAGCGALLAFEIEIGVLRCAPMPNSVNGKLPGVQEHEDAAREAVGDLRAIRRAIQCCFGSHGQQRFRDMILGDYQPLGPMGGVTGGTWTLTVSEV